jgi:hypothetical protein
MIALSLEEGVGQTPDRTRITTLDTGCGVPVAQLSWTGGRAQPILQTFVNRYRLAAHRPSNDRERHSSHKFIGFDLVHITPDPAFSRLDRANQRMLRFVEMLDRMLVLGRVATPHVSAREAKTQVNPRIAGLGTIFTHMFVGFSDFDLTKVGAFFWHRFLLGLLMHTP